MKSKLKNVLLMGLSLVLVAVIAIGGTVAYLTDTDSDVNVMTLGNVKIAQHEYERNVNDDGAYATIDTVRGTSYELVDFTQAKPLLPTTCENPSSLYWDETNVYFAQLADGEVKEGDMHYYGLMNVFPAELTNVQDKFVFVENTGKTDAYVRTIIAFEAGSCDVAEWDSLISTSTNGFWTYTWLENTVNIDGNNYVVVVCDYTGSGESGTNGRHPDGIVHPGDYTYNNLAQVYMNSKASNEDVKALDGNNNGTYDILVVSQAVQAAGFADAKTALDTGFGIANTENVAKWFGGIEFPVVGTQVSAENISDIDFTAENTTFVFNGKFEAVAISELGEGSEIYFNNATVGDLTISDDALLKGSATINSVNVIRNSVEPIVLTIAEGDLDIAGALSVKNTDGKSVLNIENSNVNFGTIFVGEHTNNSPAALAEFNVNNSTISGEENGLGSTVAVWGRSGAKATIYDSEIYTYSRGWHQSEDANDNSITVQGANNLELDIQRSNMHLYGGRSIVNLRQYGTEATTKTANISESLIWVVTKSSHGENTIPVWGVDESNIKNSILLFTKNVHQSTPAVFKSFVYGNPVIHGDYHVTTQCQWDAPIALVDGQTVTFASDANVSVYEGAGNVEFVTTGSAKVVVENGAVIKNIGGVN